MLGYDVDRSAASPKLVINAEEAARVRQIFDLYIQHRSLLPVVEALARRGWLTKSWTTKGGKPRGGDPFNKCSLYGLLTNPIYIGKIKHKSDLFNGEHSAIVDGKVFSDVHTTLQGNGRSGGTEARNRHGALLRGLLRCKACGKSMVHTFSTKHGKQYRYYTCLHAIKSGRATCPSRSLPAAEIERVVVDQIRCIGKDAKLRKEVLHEAQQQIEAEHSELRTERRDLEAELRRHHAELRKLVTRASAGDMARVAELNELIQRGETRLAELVGQIGHSEMQQIEEADVAAALADFDLLWKQLSPREQARLLSLLVDRVEYDVSAGTVSVSFHPTGIKALAQQPREVEEAAGRARLILAREGIGINDVANGVFLPRNVNYPSASMIHSTLHTNEYYRAVNEAIERAEPGTVRNVLTQIGHDLQLGKFSR